MPIIPKKIANKVAKAHQNKEKAPVGTFSMNELISRRWLCEVRQGWK